MSFKAIETELLIRRRIRHHEANWQDAKLRNDRERFLQERRAYLLAQVDFLELMEQTKGKGER